MTKILFISNTANFVKFNIPFIDFCKAKGWRVDYCSPNDEQISCCDNHYILPISRSPFSFSIFGCILRLRRLLNENNYDIIHCHTPVGAVIARLAAKRLFKKGKIKVIYTAHGFHFFKGAPKKNWLLFYPIEKILSRYTDILITINHEDYNLASSKFHAKKVVYMDGVGVNFSKFHSVDNTTRLIYRKEYKLKDEDFIMLYTAEFILRKNHKLIFDIFPQLIEKIPNLKIIFAGKGELLDFYQDYVRRNNYDKYFIFTGYTKEVDKLCKLSDLLIMPSFQEGLPISMIEALGTGLPIVCSRIRGHVDVIEDGYNGYTCALNNKDEFVNSIYSLYLNDDLRKKISANCMKSAKKYDVSLAVEKTGELYMSLL